MKGADNTTKTYYKLEEYFEEAFEYDDSYGVSLTEEQFNKSCEIIKEETYWDFRLYLEDAKGERKIFGNIIEKEQLYKYILIRQLSKNVNVRIYDIDEDEAEEIENSEIDSVFVFEAYV